MEKGKLYMKGNRWDYTNYCGTSVISFLPEQYGCSLWKQPEPKQIPCGDCGTTYVGQTNQWINEHIWENRLMVEWGLTTLAAMQHVTATQYHTLYQHLHGQGLVHHTCASPMGSAWNRAKTQHIKQMDDGHHLYPSWKLVSYHSHQQLTTHPNTVKTVIINTLITRSWTTIVCWTTLSLK